MAKKYYLPRPENDLVNWLKNYKLKLATHGATLGLTPAEITQQQGFCDAMVAAIELNFQAQHDAQEQTATKDALLLADLPRIQKRVANMKTNANYTNAIGEDLGIIGDETTFDQTNYKPEFNAQTFPGQVKLDFAKKGVQGIKFYSRNKGAPVWEFLALDTRTPYVDTRPLADPTKPETREYMGVGVINDEQVGQQSDIVTVVFGG
ncbi:MAG: hypothetical protein ACHQNT_06405 [Bacteroidia bacterium]